MATTISGVTVFIYYSIA